MLETLTNLKNNKVSKRGAAQIQAGGDAVDRMKKFIVALGKKRSGGLIFVPQNATIKLFLNSHGP